MLIARFNSIMDSDIFCIYRKTIRNYSNVYWEIIFNWKFSRSGSWNGKRTTPSSYIIWTMYILLCKQCFLWLKRLYKWIFFSRNKYMYSPDLPTLGAPNTARVTSPDVESFAIPQRKYIAVVYQRKAGQEDVVLLNVYRFWKPLITKCFLTVRVRFANNEIAMVLPWLMMRSKTQICKR